MTDPTAGASTDPVPTPESVTADPAPATIPDPSTTTEAPTVGDAVDSLVGASPDAPAPGTTEAPVVENSSGSEDPTPVVPSTTVLNRTVAGIDTSVEQGNRVVVQDPITKANPLEPIINRIEDHFSNAGHIVSDLRAIADELDKLLSTLKAGL